MKDHRITVMFPINYLGIGGAEQQLLELVRGIDKAHFEPLVVTLYPGYPLESEIRKIPGAKLISINRKGKYDFWVITKILSLLWQKEVDIIHPFLTPATLFGLLPAILYRTPVKIVTERSVQSKQRLGPRLYLKAEDFLSRFVDKVVSNSEAGREYVIQRGIPRDRIRVIYNGINLGRLSATDDDVEQVRHLLGVPPGGKIVGIMARLSAVKDHVTFLRAAAIISQAMPDTRFALVGDGPLRSYLENLSQELGIASKTVFFGDQQDVGTYLSAFDIAALTSQREGCSNSLLETMALGKPVVATDVGGNRELVNHGENGLLVPSGNAEAVASATLSLLRDSETAKVMGQRAREKVVSQFSLEKMVQQYQSLYEETLRQKGRRRKLSAAGQSSSGEPSHVHYNRGRTKDRGGVR